MKHLHLLYTFLFGVAVFLFFGLAYPHHLHYQEQYQLFLFDSTYVWEIVRQPGGVADLLGRFCTQFFLFAWVGAFIIALLLSAVQLLTLRLINVQWLYGLSFVPSFLLWLYLLDENALMSGVWAILLTLFAAWCIVKMSSGWVQRILLIIAIPILYILVGPVCLPIPVDGLWLGIHYDRLSLAPLGCSPVSLGVYSFENYSLCRKGIYSPLSQGGAGGGSLSACRPCHGHLRMEKR